MTKTILILSLALSLSNCSIINSQEPAQSNDSAIYETSPVGNSYNYFGAIDKETAKFLQTVAWDTVTSFYGW